MRKLILNEVEPKEGNKYLIFNPKREKSFIGEVRKDDYKIMGMGGFLRIDYHIYFELPSKESIR